MLKNKHNKYLNLTYEIHKEFLRRNKTICYVAENIKEAQYLKHSLKLLHSENEILLFPEQEILPYDHFSIPEKVIKERFQIINHDPDKPCLLISTVKNLFEIYPQAEYFQSSKNFSIGDNISVNRLVNILESNNYIKRVNVELINEFTIRGGIVDIYSPMYKNPLRIEIFDDKIESIRFFNVDSQLSLKNINSFSISNGSLFSLNPSRIENFVNKWRTYFHDYDERFCELFQKVKNGSIPEGIEVYLPFFFYLTVNFNDLFNINNIYTSKDLNNEIHKYNKFIHQRFEDESFEQRRPLVKPTDLYLETAEVKKIISNSKIIINSETIDIPNSFKDLVDEINSNKFKYKNLLIITSVQAEIPEIKKLFNTSSSVINEINEINPGINIMVGKPIRPFHLKDKDVVVMHKEYVDGIDSYVFENDKNLIKDSKERDFTLFKMNDYVIHDNYGLGIYDGLEIVETSNTKNEYIKIKYANSENLYVPLSNVNKISSYHKKNIDFNIQLDSLSSTKWKLKKEKALKRSIDHAAEILDIESRRQNSLSTSLKIDEQSLQEFNNYFPFEETADQISSFNAIRKDLELIKPMNRVLCGDVGFGKTEVAMRCAYISAYSNKQIIVITPSTILTDQHFNSFTKRFKNFPLSIKKLNRHTTLKNRNEIINEFNNSKIDILITTHIAFNNVINFKNTGLLIIDEEHKFGIKQKNFIKDKQSNVHILYLSATPIPRTMNMVYAGLKDFSFIQTPPSNRVNIKSFLKIQSSQLLKEALSREKSRNGQCFILQNDIAKMDSLKKEINKLLPDYKVAIAHGKQNKKQISKIMSDFQSGNLDGLICTTIVEMGLDIPNANTMIIINAQNFGLAQLHQLRGRVGRSDKQGYCYFLVPTMEIPKISMNRLNSIIKHSKIGEGFLIAQEDLEIRGGGEMLGDRQSGHIANVGMSLYLSMLKNALNSINKSLKDTEIEINFYDSTYINSDYLPSPIERLKIYRQIDTVKNLNELKKIESNLLDRCGKMPCEVINLIENKKIELLIKNSGISSIKSNKINTNFLLNDYVKDDLLNKLIDLAKLKPSYFSLTKENKFIYKLNELKSDVRRIKIKSLLSDIL